MVLLGGGDCEPGGLRYGVFPVAGDLQLLDLRSDGEFGGGEQGVLLLAATPPDLYLVEVVSERLGLDDLPRPVGRGDLRSVVDRPLHRLVGHGGFAVAAPGEGGHHQDEEEDGGNAETVHLTPYLSGLTGANVDLVIIAYKSIFVNI